ncbi:MAG: hypothetical protein [Caudoviricetes sp.]|nr:MAG: hypothetical protein [Caudoviricetes sp.]
MIKYYMLSNNRNSRYKYVLIRKLYIDGILVLFDYKHSNNPEGYEYRDISSVG